MTEIDYYSGASGETSGLKERIDPTKEIDRLVDTFKGLRRDSYGKAIGEEEHAIMNKEGCERARGWLHSMVTKITHLSRYENEERINRQVRHFAKEWVLELVQNRKRWGVRDMRAVMNAVENLLYESKLRAHRGFEASITGKAHQVSEIVSRETKESPGGLSFMKRRKDNEVY